MALLSTETTNKIFSPLQIHERRNKAEILALMAEGYYFLHPEEWPYDALDMNLDPWQKETIHTLFTGKKRRMSVRAGHGCGKSMLAAVIAHIFLMNWIPSKIIVSGPTGRQTRLQFWAYLNDMWNRSVFKNDLEWQKTKMFVRGEKNEENWFCAWVSSKNPKNMEGFHGPLEGRNLLWIIEEAKGVQDAAYEGLSGALSHEDNYLYISSTCGPPRGHFYKSHTTLRHIYDTKHVPSTISPRVSKDQIETWKLQYNGEDSPIFRARVMAEFPTGSDFAIAPLEWLEDAIDSRSRFEDSDAD